MRIRSLIVLLCALCIAACATARRDTRDAHAKHDALILVSIDGFRADYLDRGVTPTLAALAAGGVRAQALKPAFPTLTFPNHYTLVTGLYPDHHGIVANRMVDPHSGRRFDYKQPATTHDASWWRGEPIWVSAEKHGLHAATMFWPGSDVAIAGVRPSEWLPFDGTLTPRQRVDRLLAWFDLPRSRRPRFATLYFDAVDHAGHDHGPDAPEVDRALRTIDDALARLLDGLRRRGLFAHTNLVVVSDHGMTATPTAQRIDLDEQVPPTDADISYGVLAGIAPRVGREALVERALLKPHAHMHCWRKSEVPPRLHYGTNARIPALLCLAADGWVIGSHAHESSRRKVPLGEHGYDNDDPAMRALFVAHGPAFLRGLVVSEFDNVDVYPLLAHLLGIAAQPNDGDYAVVSGMLRPDAR